MILDACPATSYFTSVQIAYLPLQASDIFSVLVGFFANIRQKTVFYENGFFVLLFKYELT
ncbi:MAG: hypothetical protein ACOX3W_02815 [Christensenellaceae bacterium]|jgi:hypothetical protein